MKPYSINKSVCFMLILLLSGSLIITSCATMGKEECLNADWFTIGYEDGAKGYAAHRIGQHRKACAEHGVTPNFERYEAGRLDGLKTYCTPANGFRLGNNGKGYAGVCPKDLESAFLKGHRQGKKVYNARQVVNKQKADLDKLQADLAKLKQQQADDEAELLEKETETDRRLYLLLEIKNLTEQQSSMQDQIVEQEKRLEKARQNLNRINSESQF